MRFLRGSNPFTSRTAKLSSKSDQQIKVLREMVVETLERQRVSRGRSPSCPPRNGLPYDLSFVRPPRRCGPTCVPPENGRLRTRPADNVVLVNAAQQERLD